MTHPKKLYVNGIFGKEPESLEELFFCVIKVIESHKEHSSGKMINMPKVLGFAWELTHGQVSNSHNCPLDGKFNWTRDPSEPQFYPGWMGRVWIRYAETPVSFGSSPFNYSLTYTGTGGWGTYDGPWQTISSARFKKSVKQNHVDRKRQPNCYSWDYRFYDSDWPKLYKNDDQYKKQIFAILSEDRAPLLTSKLFWEDPDTALEDSLYLENQKVSMQPYEHQWRSSKIEKALT